MNAIEATFKNGQIIPDGPTDWPEGCRLRIEPVLEPVIDFMSEDEQGEDPESIRRWLEAFAAIAPLQIAAEEEAEWQAWQQKMKVYNIEAVRRQMAEDIP